MSVIQFPHDGPSEAKAEALAVKYPELQDPENAERLIALVHEITAASGTPDLEINVDFWEAVYYLVRGGLLGPHDAAPPSSALTRSDWMWATLIGGSFGFGFYLLGQLALWLL